jgi:hypothetical protein
LAPCINTCGGTNKNGKARPIQDKAAVTEKYFDLEENLLAGQQISLLSLAKECDVSGGLLKKLLKRLKTVI